MHISIPGSSGQTSRALPRAQLAEQACAARAVRNFLDEAALRRVPARTGPSAAAAAKSGHAGPILREHGNLRPSRFDLEAAAKSYAHLHLRATIAARRSEAPKMKTSDTCRPILQALALSHVTTIDRNLQTSRAFVGTRAGRYRVRSSRRKLAPQGPFATFWTKRPCAGRQHAGQILRGHGNLRPSHVHFDAVA